MSRNTPVRRLAGPVLTSMALVAAALIATPVTPAVAGPPATATVQAAAAGPCDAGGNPVTCENSKPGTPESEWEVYSQGTIEGFSTEFSVNAGQTIHFKIKTPARSYAIKIYRMGYYGGDGARFITPVTPSASLPQNQPNCLTNDTTGLIDCGNWQESASWAVPSTAVSGIYFARLARTDGTEDENHIVFVVRNDASTSDVLFKTSDTTWQAYNSWGGNSLYTGDSAAAAGRAVKVSYNRPFNTRDSSPWGRDFVFANEYPMVRFLEAQGYDMSYMSGIDADRRGNLIKNHKVFLSVGHDEYWSGAERANVEAARDAGVNLAFFSGNEVFWKTRWENSTDGSNTLYRTLVTYKETRANAQIDPSGSWTGTWRDPRFSPPADGGRPENALTGSIWTVNCCGVPMKVPAADGKLRFWRGTPNVAGQSAGNTFTLPDQTLGYEWDEDLDNGSRPAGLIRMSTTTANVPEKLQDYGSTVAPGSATHHLTLYRAPSGALVFGGGTVQWSWGLDTHHDGPEDAPNATSRDMQQATVNLLADMNTQPKTLQSGLNAATASTDHTAPTSTVTSPSAGANLTNGNTVTVSGTATDAGGGQVGGVEVSTDGGSTWHPANGRGTWTYSWDPTGAGAVTIKTRATDDSGNIEIPGSGVTVNVKCPCSLFGGSATPTVAAENDAGTYELGVKFRAAVDGWVTGVKFYKGTGNVGTHTGTLWGANGARLATATFTNETATGWQTVKFPVPVRVTANTTYVASYFAPNGRYASDGGYFATKAQNSPPLTGLRTGTDGGNGVYYAGDSAFPTSSFNGGNYWVDVVFDTVEPPDTTPPAVTAAAPYPGSSSVPRTAQPSVTFSEPVQTGTPSFTVKDGTTTVPGTASLNGARTTLTFAPTSQLPAGKTLTATVTNAQDAAGNAMSAYSYTFTTSKAAPPPGQCPCSIWPDEAPAATDVHDSGELELGVKFRADTDGSITGIRFYKGANNTGTHTGTLWSANGTQLATATFTNEGTAGWQEVQFSSPVQVTAGTTYVASYHTPTGWFSASGSGLTNGVDNPPLRALASDPYGGNGVFKYGARAFPSQSYNATNYWVDVVFTVPPDTTAPTVSATNPADDATSVPTGSSVKATFSEAVQSGSPSLTLKDAGGSTISGSTSLDATGKVLTFNPSSALSGATRYTATVSGAKDAADNTMTATSWSFTTSGACPCTIWPSDAKPTSTSIQDSGSVELGVKFSANTNGWISGVRFYKGAGNTGTHTGSLWTANGTRLVTGTFTSESSSGWQTLTFSSPVQVNAGTTYVASYHAPNGHYAGDGGYFANAFANGPLTALADGPSGGNGVYAYGSTTRFPNNSWGATNYWVDPIFSVAQPGDTTPPAVDTVDPVNGQTSVPPGASLSATFDEPVQGGTVQFSVTGPGGTAVPGSVSYNQSTKTATFQPTGNLAWSTEYTARVSGAADLLGNTMPAAFSWTVKTARQTTPGVCPCSIWADADAPAVADVSDPDAVELGVRFQPDTNGQITGLRFYKGPSNTGTHVGTLWAADGTQLARATFTDESAAGWQQVLFSTPVNVTAGTTYVASYTAPNGHYAVTSGAFSSAGVDSPPLHALQGGGRYVYGGGFPANTSNSNYWVDVVFRETP